ncbi:putative pyridoxal phosphate-dependent enzyme [Gaiella occulta]|uniref:Putative pyridoxal phosphate-dependent enzyme n=1 Tax=Gaiella occulta TaxID=1002870 RepID=A0A7M2YXJ2_9ACTN|nr:DegT/DnrJ/EryC1/StrS aminotransferase family protein [Gaiella occulta]RDI74853.1 putative pyridoxal phosphate-dependent enzyme [Gaiella occulta]
MSKYEPHADATPRRSEYLVFGQPEILDEDIDEVVSVLRSRWIGAGPRASRFEEQFRLYTGAAHAVAVSSCTAALHLALLGARIAPGDEVIVPAMTFAATANVVVHAGGVPVIADVDRDTMCLSPTDIERRITPRTRAVIAVHFAGRPFDIDAIFAVADAHGLTVIEDCAHAIETTVGGRHAGTFGAFSAFSFYVTKNVVTAEGGMLLTHDPDAAARARRLALHGLSADAWKRFSDDGFKHYEVEEPGFKYNMTDIQAALGLHQLARVERSLERRNEIWARYDDAFVDLPAATPAPVRPGTRHARHLYTLLLDLDHLDIGRDRVQRELHELGIGTGIHYRALHLHPYYRDRLPDDGASLANATWISERTISLPLGPSLTDDDVDDVIAAVTWVLRRHERARRAGHTTSRQMKPSPGAANPPRAGARST